MAAEKLTDLQIRNLKPRDKDYRVADGNGLSIRVLKNSGVKQFVYRYRIDGKLKDLRLGTYPETSLQQARQELAKCRAWISDGIDPKDGYNKEKESHRLDRVKAQQEKLAPTFRDVTNQFYELHLSKLYKRPEQALDHLEQVMPVLGSMKIEQIKRADISRALDLLVRRGARVRANRVMSLVKKVFRFALERELLQDDPSLLITRFSVGGREKARVRALSELELKAVIKSVTSEDFQGGWQTKLILMMLLGTAQRVGEVINMQWKDINLQAGTWEIKENKADRPHVVHLSNFTRGLVDQAAQLTSNKKFVFASDINDHSPVTVRSIARAVTRHIDRKLFDTEINGHKVSVDKFTPHDLRRTAATHMAEMEIAPHIIEKILNHQMTGVMAVYNRAEYLKDREAAINTWGEYLEGLTNDAS